MMIAWSWLQTVNHFYKQHHKLIENTILPPASPMRAAAGSTPQDGFGWTNGVVRR